MTLKLSDLIAAYGDNEVIFQNLDGCADALNWSAKNGSRITFRTSEVVTLEGTNKLGLVVWLDRKRVAEIVAAAKAA